MVFGEDIKPGSFRIKIVKSIKMKALFLSAARAAAQKELNKIVGEN